MRFSLSPIHTLYYVKEVKGMLTEHVSVSDPRRAAAELHVLQDGVFESQSGHAEEELLHVLSCLTHTHKQTPIDHTAQRKHSALLFLLGNNS